MLSRCREQPGHPRPQHAGLRRATARAALIVPGKHSGHREHILNAMVATALIPILILPLLCPLVGSQFDRHRVLLADLSTLKTRFQFYPDMMDFTE